MSTPDTTCKGAAPNQRSSSSLAQRRGSPLGQRRSTAENQLIDEITTAAQRVADARDSYGEPICRTDAAWRVIQTVAASRYCLTIADLARALGVRKQVAHELAHSAVRAGVINLVPNPQDKRILQLLLTPKGRAAIAAAHAAESIWLATLLNGLRDQDLATATHVVRVIRQRLERDAREWAQRKASPPKA